jgi:hypothetical protein
MQSLKYYESIKISCVLSTSHEYVVGVTICMGGWLTCWNKNFIKRKRKKQKRWGEEEEDFLK